MHVVSQLRRTLAMTTVLISLLAGLGVASAQADAPILTGGGGRQTPRVAKQTPATLPSSAINTPLPTPSPIQATAPLNPTANPNTLSTPTGTQDNTGSPSTKPFNNNETDSQATHRVRFDPADGSKRTQSAVKTGTLVVPPEHNPAREGFRFDGWTLDNQLFDFQTPILQDTTLTAQWSKATDWTLSPDHGPASGALLTISPPDRQEPQFTSVHATGEQIVGLTGDGRIYTWTQDNRPTQVPAPAQAPDGFHYLQAAVGSRWQAALGSDQHIYTWAHQQATPGTLDTGQNTRFTSISMNDDRLLAVDLQGQVRTFQASQPGTQDLNPKFTDQITNSLPGQAQAITAAASGSRVLIVDADGQAWRWDTNKIGSIKPARIKQDQGIRIIQAQALNQGFLLLDANGQANYLADSTTSAIAVSLPDGGKAGTITGNGSQAMITDTNGQVWAWQPGKTPMRADNGDQHYMQAAEAGSRIIALDSQGDMLAWSLDAQGKPGKPARLNTNTAPTLESASMDSQPLKLTKTGDVWQTPIPAHKPGPAAILITSRQDGQTFTRSLNYTVDQQLTRDTEPNTTHTVTFNTDSGTPKPADQQVSYPYGRVQRPSPDPTRDGYQFDGWFTGNIAYDFSKPVTTDLTLTAHWTPNTQNNQWRINPDKGSQLGNETTTIIPPDTSRGIRVSQISGSKENYEYGFSLAVGSDGDAYAWGNNTYGQLGDGTTTYYQYTPVRVKTPDRKTYPDLPEDFTYVQISAGQYHSLALGSDGYVYAWGSNSNGVLGNNSSSPSYAPVRVRDPNSPTDASKGLKAIQVSAGGYHSLAVGTDEYAYAWGLNNNGQLGNNSSSSSYVPVRVRDPNSPTDASKGLKAIQVSAGNYHSLALDKDGNAWAWGSNGNGELGNNSSSSSYVPVRVRDPNSPTDASKGLKATQVSAGNYYSLAVGSNEYAYAWGNNGFGKLGNNSSSSSYAPVRVRDPNSPTDASKGLKATQVSAGGFHSLALDKDGNAWAWGDDDHGQLGRGTYTKYSYPVKVFASSQSTNSAGPWLNAVQISAGNHHSLAINTDGNIKAWGYNNYGRLGDGTTRESTVPVPVAFNLQPVISAVRFDTSPAKSLNPVSNSNNVTVTTPAHQPGTVTVSVDYTMGGIGSTLTDKSLTYTYTPLGVLPRAGGEGVLLALATGMTGMGGVLASRRHRQETRQLSHASLE
ncbi:InlB B-repeat-containing protein [Bifidobacterium asteroides]|uniref:RCC1 domain-containing protein n=1 Tax=Bifidobacterium asteroides TaxID=1684 RepID=UPI0027423E66|nr:InlB B-repeat-containing protein [Bifidobacterium asteroides]WLT11043.1 InlB B-repeat-containing protein [Bifidobacterium asteroides]